MALAFNPDPIKMTRPRAVLGQMLQWSQTFGSLVRNDTSGELSSQGTDNSGRPSDACCDDFSDRLMSDRG